jgi:hypothetical protein
VRQAEDALGVVVEDLLDVGGRQTALADVLERLAVVS